MSEKIKSSDIFEGDIFKIVVDSAELAKTKISELNEELVKVGTSFKKELKSVKTDNVKEINDLIVKVKELTSAVETQTKVNKANEIAIREAKKTSEQALREEEKTKREALKTQEQINKSDERALANKKKLSGAYKELSDNTRDLKNESKRLGAEMLELEKQGKKNSAEYYKLSKQYKETTKSAIEGDKALKKLDSTVGDNFRNVGNYQKAIGGLKNALMQLGLAFGVFDGIRYLLDTQIKLDSLNLSLKNVSGSSIEYGKNFKFLTEMSRSYGQDLLVLMGTYKGFIASTESSNLSLSERKRIYESIIKSSSALALSNQDTEGALRAVSQMFSKGTVSAEELRQQLGERLPGAFGIMAKSMGVSEAQLNDLMKKGLVLADDVMPAFATELEIAFGSKASARLHTLGGAFNVLKTEIALYFDNVQKGVGLNETLSTILLTLGRNIKPIISFVGTLLHIWVSYNTVIKVSALSQELMNSAFVKGIRNGKGFAGVLDSIKNSASNLGDVLYKNFIGIFALMVTEFAVTEMKLKSIRNKIKEYRNELKTNENELILDSSKEKLELKSLFEALENTNYESQRRAEIIDEINSKYGTTIKNLKDEKEFTDQLNASYAGINETLDKKLAKDKARIAYEITQRQLQDAKLAMDLIGYEYLSFLEKSKLSKYASNLLDPIGARGENEILRELNALTATYNSIKKIAKDAEKEYKKSLTIPVKGRGKKDYTPDPIVKGVLEHTKEVRDLNVEYNKTNIYLSRQLEILKDIDKIKSEDKMQEAIDKTRIALDKEEKSVNLTGKYSAGAVQTAIELEQKAKKEFEEKRFQAEKEDKKIRDTKTFNDELIAVEEQEKTKLKQLSEIQSDTERKLVDARINLKKKNLSKSGKQELKAEIENLKAQLEINKDYAKQIKEGADKEKAQVYENDIKRQEDTNLEIEGLQKNHEKNMANIKRDSVEKMQDTLDKLELIRAEKRLEVIKNTAESVNNLIQKSLEHYIDLAERRIDTLDKRMERMSTQADFLREKAVSGSIQAQESLAQLDVQQLETEKQKINEQKSIQKLQIAMTVFQAYSNNIQNAKVGENPFTKTLTDITLLNQLANTVSNGLPAYFDGTEDTGSNGQGVDGKGGFHAVLHPNERVIPKALNSKIGDLSNLEIAKLAEDFHRGEVMRKGDGAMQLNVGSWSTDMIVSELQDLKNVIKNKPESNIELGEIVGGVMHIMETKKTGNTKVRNISRFS
jgi:tape measure domain-containing protein